METNFRALERDGQALAYMRNKFPKFSEIKVKEGIFVGLEMWEVVKDREFNSNLSDTENAVWNAFKSVCTNCLGESQNGQN